MTKSSFGSRHTLVLRQIAARSGCTRKEAAALAGLDKNTANQIISDWMACGILSEQPGISRRPAAGRTASLLRISDTAPLAGGMLLKRGLLSAVIGTLDGVILKRRDYTWNDSCAPDFVGILCTMFDELRRECSRPVIGIGIASIGPVDLPTRTISPAYFYGIADFPVCRLVEQRTGLPAFLINDTSAGALAEKMWGAGQALSDFLYLHIMNGIGTGLILNGRLYNGTTGKSGEIGHTTINADGPVCDCGRRGCLDLYTGMDSLNRQITALKRTLPVETCLPDRSCTWSELISACGAGDPIALTVLNDFCVHVTAAVCNMLKILDIRTLILGYEAAGKNTVLEQMMAAHLNRNLPETEKITLSTSRYLDSASLYGALAAVCDAVFDGALPLTDAGR